MGGRGLRTFVGVSGDRTDDDGCSRAGSGVVAGARAKRRWPSEKVRQRGQQLLGEVEIGGEVAVRERVG